MGLEPICDVDRIIWDRDARGFTLAATSDGTSELFRVAIDSGGPKKISNFRHDQIYTLDWSLDGNKLAVVRGRIFLDMVLLKDTEQ